MSILITHGEAFKIKRATLLLWVSAALFCSLTGSIRVYASSSEDTRCDSRLQMRKFFFHQFKAMGALETPSTIKAIQKTTHDKYLPETEDHFSSWIYQAFMIRIRPDIGFKIPGMVTLSIVPETEFYWSKN